MLTGESNYLHGPGIDEPLQALTDEFWGFFVSDGLGSVKKLVNMAGVVRQTYEYDSFGRLLAVRDGDGDLITPDMPGFIHQPYTFTGRERDWESGLYYYRARYYDAESGRFIGEDPIWGINPYEYVENNPIIFTDPFGLRSLIAVNLEVQVGIVVVFSHSKGAMYVFDPQTGDAYVYKYATYGVGPSWPFWTVAGSAEVGTYDTSKPPDDLSGSHEDGPAKQGRVVFLLHLRKKCVHIHQHDDPAHVLTLPSQCFPISRPYPWF